MTKDFSEAIELLRTDDLHALGSDFDDVFTMFSADVQALGGKRHADAENKKSAPHATKKASLMDAQRVEAAKASVVSLTQDFGEAMKELRADSDMQTLIGDFKQVVDMYRDDVHE